MKSHKIVLAVIIASLVVSACGGPASNSSTKNIPESKSSNSSVSASGESYKPLTIKISYTMSDTAIDGIVANYMKEQLSKRSSGAIKLETYGNATLASGNMAREVEMLISGVGFEMGILGEQLFAAQDVKMNVANIPFAFDSYDNAYKFADSTGGEWSTKELANLGVTKLGTFSNGLFQLGNRKKEIRTPDDLKNMKIRGVGDLNLEMTRAFGCDATSLNFSELYSALQMGTVDGQTNGYLTMDTASLQEVQPYITELNCQWVPFDIVYNSTAWNKLPDNTKTLIQEVAKDSAEYGRKYMTDQETKIKDKFTKAGVKITTLSADERQVFIDKEKAVIDEYITKCGDDACKAWGIKK